jgi:hypothetical protein
MPRSCTICRHPQLTAIEQALREAIPLRTIADQWSVSKSALIRHKQAHLSMGSKFAPYGASALVATRPDGSHLFPEISASKKRAFLSAFAQLGKREAAAAALGIDIRTHRYWMQKDVVYVEAFKRAEAVVADRIEDEIFRRGVEGIERGVWYHGVQVGTERHYSDTLLIFAAKGACPRNTATASTPPTTSVRPGRARATVAGAARCATATFTATPGVERRGRGGDGQCAGPPEASAVRTTGHLAHARRGESERRRP